MEGLVLDGGKEVLYGIMESGVIVLILLDLILVGNGNFNRYISGDSILIWIRIRNTIFSFPVDVKPFVEYWSIGE